MVACVPNGVVDQNLFPSIQGAFEEIAALPLVIVGDGCKVVVGGTVNWKIESIFAVNDIVVQFLLAKTPLDNPIEQTLYVFEDGVHDKEIPVLSSFQWVDFNAESTAVYRLYAKILSTSPANTEASIVPVTVFSIVVEAF